MRIYLDLDLFEATELKRKLHGTLTYDWQGQGDVLAVAVAKDICEILDKAIAEEKARREAGNAGEY